VINCVEYIHGNKTNKKSIDWNGSVPADIVFRAIVKQAMAGKPWRDVCASIMKSRNIQAADVEAEVQRLQEPRKEQDAPQIDSIPDESPADATVQEVLQEESKQPPPVEPEIEVSPINDQAVQTQAETTSQESSRIAERARKYFERMSFFARGIAHVTLKQYREAIEYYNQAIALESDDLIIYHYRAAAFAELRQLDKAIEDYSKVIELDPNCITAHFNRAMAYVELGRYEQAFAACSKVAELDTNDTTAYCIVHI
jgi:tetratricopeptide (TPR) repeat protein